MRTALLLVIAVLLIYLAKIYFWPGKEEPIIKHPTLTAMQIKNREYLIRHYKRIIEDIRDQQYRAKSGASQSTTHIYSQAELARIKEIQKYQDKVAELEAELANQ